eukprot:CAMPEP_0204356796 /NCGR_PEP_ID=MMETSP0469-20131031/35216_1 /ASSEMBLY_ACC=CAM_ASM_000384 /TAXON_ID=2969 /ORGANISM="Oxyrrhis marina" /LENGTH=381 /DNA_ID=CAMNT_0051344321 /DNA_START=17 /DNA_END=1159 /DNA_ORIENTATION=+
MAETLSAVRHHDSPIGTWTTASARIGDSLGHLAHGIFSSLVRWCDSGELLDPFFACPVIYVYGTLSGKCGPLTQQLLGRHPAAVSGGVRGGGHFFLCEQVPETVAVLRALLQGRRAGTPGVVGGRERVVRAAEKHPNDLGFTMDIQEIAPGECTMAAEDSGPRLFVSCGGTIDVHFFPESGQGMTQLRPGDAVLVPPHIPAAACSAAPCDATCAPGYEIAPTLLGVVAVTSDQAAARTRSTPVMPATQGPAMVPVSNPFGYPVHPRAAGGEIRDAREVPGVRVLRCRDQPTTVVPWAGGELVVAVRKLGIDSRKMDVEGYTDASVAVVAPASLALPRGGALLPGEVFVRRAGWKTTLATPGAPATCVVVRGAVGGRALPAS